MSWFASADRFRRPEYTGANRCLPCTILNVVLAALVAGVLGAVWLPLGVATGLLAAAVIYLRGYLVPGTPWLTERFLPERVLAWFEQHKAPPAPDVDPEDADVGELLFELGVVRECQDGREFCLVDGVREAWREELDRLRASGTERADLAAILDADPERLTFHEPSDDGLIARVDDIKVGQWESEAAFLADLGAARALDREVPAWQRFDVPTKGALLNGLRLFAEACPDCGGAVRLGEETVQSCCRSHEVVAATCAACGARLFEADHTP